MQITITIPFIPFSILKGKKYFFDVIKNYLYTNGIYKCCEPKFCVTRVGHVYQIVIHDYK